MSYDKNNRPSSKRHNYLIDKMTIANLLLLKENEELLRDNRKIISDWSDERKRYRKEIASLSRKSTA